MNHWDVFVPVSFRKRTSWLYGKKLLNIFLEHFKKLNSVSTPSHNDCNISYEVIDNSNLNKTISLDEVKCSLKKIRNRESAGHDDVFPEFLKYANDAIVNLPTFFFNKVLVSGVVPDDWGLSIYRPLHKKGDRWNPNI